MKTYQLFASLALLLSSAAFAQSPPTTGLGCTPSAHVFCVTNTQDDTTPTGPAGSLRRAISDSDNAGGANTIGFNIPSPNPSSPVPQTITLATGLPYMFGASVNPLTAVTIDGYSQPGSALNTNAPDQGGLNAQLMIEVIASDSGTGFAADYTTTPTALTVQGLVLHGFYTAIAGGTGGVTVHGCYIGTNITGTGIGTGGSYRSGNAIAIQSLKGNAQIGGTQSWQRNLISASSGGYAAIVLYTDAGSTAVVEGNLIGTDATGTQPIRNQTGILVTPASHAGNTVVRIGCTSSGNGCASAASRNVISGNADFTNSGVRAFGIWVTTPNATPPNYVGWEIKGNYIGTDWTGTQPLPNGVGANSQVLYGGGIELDQTQGDPSSLIIGGFGTGEANLIAFNAGAGIEASYYAGSPGNFDSQRNAVHDNAGLGGTNITLTGINNPPQPLANDPGDADTGPNGLQNYPEIQSASVSGGKLTVTYKVDSTTTNSSYPLRIDFYVDVDGGSGEFLASDSYPATSAQQLRTVTLTLPANAQSPVGFVTTATTATGYTSEFSDDFVFDRIFEDGFEGY